MDWVDITAALKADPEKAADMLKGVSTWSLNSANEFRNVQKKIQALVDSGQLGIFANGYFGHAAMKLPPEVNLIAVAHYLQALECQRDANRVVALLGSKTPHIQNLAIGGVANPINLDSQAVLNQERLMFVKACIDRLTDLSLIHIWFLKFRQSAFTNPDSYFKHYANLSEQEAIETASNIWDNINGLNLKQNILPTRERANLILRKGENHEVELVKLRK